MTTREQELCELIASHDVEGERHLSTSSKYRDELMMLCIDEGKETKEAVEVIMKIKRGLRND